MFQGNLLEPKKGKTVGSAADMTIEYLIDILTYIFVQTFPTGRFGLCLERADEKWIWDGYKQMKSQFHLLFIVKFQLS